MSSSHRPALGRGLGALIPQTGAGAVDGDGGGVAMVDIDLITPNPEQPRMHFDPQALQELADSIREHGVLQPVVVTQVASDLGPIAYQLIAGERRLQAARIAGVEKMPVVIKEAAGNALLEIALVENLQRQDLDPIEEATAFKRLAGEFGMTQDQIAKRVGRSRTAVANTMRLLSLHEDIRRSLASGQISEGHARALLAIDNETERLDAWRKIVSEGMSVRDAEDIARALRTLSAPQGAAKTAGPSQPLSGRSDPHMRDLESRLRVALGTRVALSKTKNGGRIVIRFHNDEELEGLIGRLTAGS